MIAGAYRCPYTPVYGQARLHEGHDPRRRERLGRLAALLQLPEASGEPSRAPCPLLRGAAQSTGHKGPCPLSRLLRSPGGGPVAALRGTLPRARRPPPAAPALFRPGRALLPPLSGRPVRVPGHLADPRLPFGLLPAALGRAGRQVDWRRLRRDRAARDRAR